jgi:hypothetical protein
MLVGHGVSNVTNAVAILHRTRLSEQRHSTVRYETVEH